MRRRGRRTAHGAAPVASDGEGDEREKSTWKREGARRLGHIRMLGSGDRPAAAARPAARRPPPRRSPLRKRGDPHEPSLQPGPASVGTTAPRGERGLQQRDRRGGADSACGAGLPRGGLLGHRGGGPPYAFHTPPEPLADATSLPSDWLTGPGSPGSASRGAARRADAWQRAAGDRAAGGESELARAGEEGGYGAAGEAI